MLTGTVRYFDTMRGVGSIAPDGGGPELFVHFTDIRMEGFKVLREGQKVSYVVEMGSRGPQATNVRPLDG
jgi:CspA family cold shock protein